MRQPKEDPTTAEKKLREMLDRGVRRLRFEPDMERAFRRRHLEETALQVRFSLGLGLFAYLTFFLLDRVVFPEDAGILLILRYAVAAPPVAAVWLYLIRHRPTVWGHRLYAAATVWIGASLIALLALVPKDRVALYQPALLLVTFHVLAFSGLRTATAVPAAWSILALYAAAEPLLIHSDSVAVVNNLSGLVAANLVGLGAAYLTERAQRRAFLQERFLELESRRHAELALCDALTGLANRRRVDRALPEEWHRAVRFHYPIAVVMMDVDFFKEFNDALGHQAGDRCLQALARTLEAWVRRPGDLAARYGGEEFLLLLPGTALEDAILIAEEVRRSVEGLQIRHPASRISHVVTVSAGVASTVPATNTAPGDLLRAADAALYRAKAGGRNRVEPPRATVDTRRGTAGNAG